MSKYETRRKLREQPGTCDHGYRPGLCLICADRAITELREEVGWLRGCLEDAEATIQAYERGVRSSPRPVDARTYPSAGTDAREQWREKEARVTP